MQPSLCFVLMPFGEHSAPDGHVTVDFEMVFRDFIEPAVRNAGLIPIRADQEVQGGIFHKRMFERLSLCEYAVADLSFSNPNVFYELGIRHARRPWSTVLLHQKGRPLPLDVALASAMQYSPESLRDEGGLADLKAVLTRRLTSSHARIIDSPVFQLVTGLSQLDVEHTRLDAFVRDALEEDADSRFIAQAAARGLESLVQASVELGNLDDRAPEVVVTLVKAFRDHKAWEMMIFTIDAAEEAVSTSWVIQELRALALGRLKRFGDAASILNDLLRRRENSETYGLLGGVYKRQWRAAIDSGRPDTVCASYLRKAAAAYRAGFECDWRDPYPGVNAVMLTAIDSMTIDPLITVVGYAVERRLSHRHPEYWDYVCALELAIVRGDRLTAETNLGEMLAAEDQPFDPNSTLIDLKALLPLCVARRDDDWVTDIIHALEDSA